MAVGANTYGTVVRVETLIGDIVVSRDFTTGTTPTEAQIEGFLDDIANEINMHLKANGYTVPVSSTDYVETFGYMRSINSYGAAALALGMLPSEAVIMPNGAMVDTAKARRAFYESKYKEGLALISKHKLHAALSSTSIETYAGSEENSDGDRKLPIFTRDVTDNPNSRTLTEPT